MMLGQSPGIGDVWSEWRWGQTGVWGFSAPGVGLNAEFYRAASPGKPYQVAIQRGVRMYHDQTTRPINDMRWQLLTLLSHGAFVTMVDKTAFDGSLDPVAYQRIGHFSVLNESTVSVRTENRVDLTIEDIHETLVMGFR
jgi:hypothetical protein